jgi:Tfp pilus assembly protein PilV
MKRRRRLGFSLLELLLATTILLGAVTVLGQLVHIGSRNARSSHLLSTAQLLAETKLAEIAAGVEPAETTEQAAFEETTEWTYSLEQESTEHEGISLVRITVNQVVEPPRKPVRFTAWRWVADKSNATDPEAAPPSTAATSPNATAPGGMP